MIRNKNFNRNILSKGFHYCVNCGETNKRLLTIDHIVPLSAGGDNSKDNIQILCHDCHRVRTNHYRQQRLTQTTADGKIVSINTWRGLRAKRTGSRSPYAYRSKAW